MLLPGHFLLLGLLPYAPAIFAQRGLLLDISSFPFTGLRIFSAFFAQQGELLFEFVVHQVSVAEGCTVSVS